VEVVVVVGVDVEVEGVSEIRGALVVDGEVEG
jgi:hypothetical protein